MKKNQLQNVFVLWFSAKGQIQTSQSWSPPWPRHKIATIVSVGLRCSWETSAVRLWRNGTCLVSGCGRCLLWNDIAHSASRVSTLSSVREKEVYYHPGKGSPSNPPPQPSSTSSSSYTRGAVITEAQCVCSCVQSEGVHRWGMCTCNFSHSTQSAFCRVSGRGGVGLNPPTSLKKDIFTGVSSISVENSPRQGREWEGGGIKSRKSTWETEKICCGKLWILSPHLNNHMSRWPPASQ